jgi:hypothetical protein
LENQRAWWKPRRLTFGDFMTMAVCAAIGCAGTSFMMYRGPEDGLPSGDKLAVTSGRIAYVGNARAGRSGHYTVFRLATSPVVFKFTGPMGDYTEVKDALCPDCQASIWSDPHDQSGRPFAWQIEVNGKMIARYSDVKAHWISDRRMADWMAPIAGVLSIGFVALAFRRKRDDTQRSDHRRA